MTEGNPFVLSFGEPNPVRGRLSDDITQPAAYAARLAIGDFISPAIGSTTEIPRAPAPSRARKTARVHSARAAPGTPGTPASGRRDRPARRSSTYPQSGLHER